MKDSFGIGNSQENTSSLFELDLDNLQEQAYNVMISTIHGTKINIDYCSDTDSLTSPSTSKSTKSRKNNKTNYSENSKSLLKLELREIDIPDNYIKEKEALIFSSLKD